MHCWLAFTARFIIQKLARYKKGSHNKSVGFRNDLMQLAMYYVTLIFRQKKLQDFAGQNNSADFRQFSAKKINNHLGDFLREIEK